MQSDAWATQDAGRIRGSDGSAFPPYLSRSEKYPIFLGNVYRSIDLEYVQDVSRLLFLPARSLSLLVAVRADASVLTRDSRCAQIEWKDVECLR